jgi:hypothetical protein
LLADSYRKTDLHMAVWSFKGTPYGFGQDDTVAVPIHAVGEAMGDTANRIRKPVHPIQFFWSEIPVIPVLFH